MARSVRKKNFQREWTFDPFSRDDSFYSRSMFGGLAAYFQGRMVMVLMEDPGEKSYRGKTYKVDLWDGLLLPTEKAHHESLQKEFPNLISHPVLGKWLYLPASDNCFESVARELGQKIAGHDLRIGIEPGMKIKKSRLANEGLKGKIYRI